VEVRPDAEHRDHHVFKSIQYDARRQRGTKVSFRATRRC